MTDSYLLTTSLLTVGTVGLASVPPSLGLPPNLPNNLSNLLTASAARMLQPIANDSIDLPAVGIFPELGFYPEFSSYSSNTTKQLTQDSSEAITLDLTPKAEPALIELAAEQQTFSQPNLAFPSPVSGTQFYHQRLAALQAGKIYTRLSSNSFQSSWASDVFSEALPSQKPNYGQWKHLLEEEARAISVGQGANKLAILVGDSLTMWFPSARLPHGQIWLNQAISGENTSQILQRLPAFSQTRPSTIYVMAGTNDLRQGVTDQIILNNLRQIVLRLRRKHPQSQIILQSILPTRSPEIPNQRVHNLNQQIAIIAQQEGAGYLNLYTLFTDDQDQLRQDLTTDGIHLTPRGYQVWQRALQYAEAVMAVNQDQQQNIEPRATDALDAS
ncbi:GDSL-type esterase/lipase family protein [Lyngbya aestuarii]|uniref:GDSL-type esterase/lipase family protein n=1 Tax=Lyngbya aestuarii TaxID=118322 RepID=UPI00403DDEAE